MASFEYKQIVLDRFFDGGFMLSQLNEYGEDGWDVVCIQDDIAVLKRQYQGGHLNNEERILLQLGNTLSQLQATGTHLAELLQEIAEKICPDSEVVASYKEMLQAIRDRIKAEEEVRKAEALLAELEEEKRITEEQRKKQEDPYGINSSFGFTDF